MLDIVNSDATQERARNLNALFAGKQIADTYTPGAPHNTVAFTDGTHVTINAATILPGGATAPADKKALAVDADNFTNSDDEHYKKHDSGRIVRAWVEKTDTHQEPTYYGDDEETTETISLYIMFEGDLRPTLITNNTTRYSRKAEHPDFRLKRGSINVTADSARISSSFHRPCDE